MRPYARLCYPVMTGEDDGRIFHSPLLRGITIDRGPDEKPRNLIR